MKKGILLVLLVLSACATETSPSFPTNTPRPAAPTSRPIVVDNSIPSSQAISYIGQRVTVRINRASCSYEPGVDGQPTFCNDKPFPSHDFTMLVWGNNWSDYNGDCLLVTGEVTVFDGKAQIIVGSRSQVKNC